MVGKGQASAPNGGFYAPIGISNPIFHMSDLQNPLAPMPYVKTGLRVAWVSESRPMVIQHPIFTAFSRCDIAIPKRRMFTNSEISGNGHGEPGPTVAHYPNIRTCRKFPFGNGERVTALASQS